MPEQRRVVAALWMVLSLGACAVALGCRGRSDGAMAQAIDKAQRLYDKACALLNDPVYQVGQEYSPLMRIVPSVDPNAVRAAPGGTLNPQAWDALEQARQTLRKALASPARQGTPVEVARGQAVLARVEALRAYHRSIQADQARDRARKLLGEVEQAAVEMSDHGKRIASADKLLGTVDKSVDQMAQTADADATSAAARIKDLEAKIKQMQDDKAALEQANEKLSAEARKLRVDSLAAETTKGVDLLDQALAKEDELTANSAKIMAAEDGVARARSEMAIYKQAAEAATERKAAAAKIVGGRQKRDVDLRKQREDFVKRLSDSQKAVEVAAGKASEVILAAAGLDKEALSDYEEAGKLYQESLKRAEFATPAMTALHGDVLMERADLQVRRLAFQARLAQVKDAVTKLWSDLPVQREVPAMVGKLAGYLETPGQVKASAESDFDWSRRRYEDALEQRGLKDQHKWAYRLEVAAAAAGRYRLSGAAEDRQKGLEALKALSDEEGSPYLSAHVKHFRKLLEQAPVGPSSAPAEAAPTPPAPPAATSG